MKSVPYRAQFVAYVLAMMADNIEHVISYWVVFQKFHSPALAGFAVLAGRRGRRDRPQPDQGVYSLMRGWF